jgi:chromosome segregation ATPase
MGATASRLPELEAAQAQVRRVTAHLERATASLAESSSKLSSVQAEAARLKLQVTQPQRHPRPS